MFLLKCVFFAIVFLIGLCYNAELENNFSNKLSFLRSHHKKGHGRIVGGFAANIEDNPWQIGLIYSGRTICGGSIIGEKWVLTAAHCIIDSSNYQVRAGSSHLNHGGEVIDVDRIIKHPGYTKRNDNDFALLHLSERLEFSDRIRSIDLAEHATDGGTVCQASGWGTTSFQGRPSRTLLAVDVPIYDHKACNQRYGYGKITRNMICAGYEDGKKDACQGDSGGPLTCNGRLVGVVSFGKECATPDFPGVYAEVAAARSWIRQETGI